MNAQMYLRAPFDPPQEGEGYRQAIIYITPPLLVSMFAGYGLWLPAKVHEGLPRGARYVRMFKDPQQDLIGVVVESEEFLEIKPGELLPTITPSFQTLSPEEYTVEYAKYLDWVERTPLEEGLAMEGEDADEAE